MGETRNSSTSVRLISVVVVLLVAAVGYLLYETSSLRGELAQTNPQGGGDSIAVDTSDAAFGWPDEAWWRRPMDSAGWDPFEEMERMQKQMRRMFDQSFNPAGGMSFFDEFGTGFGGAPEVDLEEQDDRFVVHVDMQGIDESALNIEVKDDVLTISGERKAISEQKDAQGNVIGKSQSSSQFSRSLSLPVPVDAGRMKTHYEDGKLQIELPKKYAEP